MSPIHPVHPPNFNPAKTMHLNPCLVEVVNSGIQTLQTDHTNGARILALSALQTLHSLLLLPSLSSNVSSKDDLWTVLLQSSLFLRDARPSMSAAINSALCAALIDVLTAWGQEPKHQLTGETTSMAFLIQIAQKAVHTRIGLLETSLERLADVFADWMRRECELRRGRLRILTLSFSSTMLGGFRRAMEKYGEVGVEVRVLESRPGFEGAVFAAELAKSAGASNNFSVQVAPDSHVALLAKDVDIVFLGADRITGTGNVSNKTGSLAAVLCAKALNPHVRVVVVSETGKIVANDGGTGTGDHTEEENDLTEVTEAWEAKTPSIGVQMEQLGVSIRNVYFEWVEGGLVSEYITDIGILGKDEILSYSNSTKELEEQNFGLNAV